MLIYTLFIFLLCFFTLRYAKNVGIDGINKWIIPTAFSIKVLVGLSFLYIYTEIYGNGKLSGDAGDFMMESKLLNDVFFQSPTNYFKFLFGLDNTNIASYYLAEAKHWGAGQQAVINDSRNILRIHSIIHFFSFGIAYIHVIAMCLLSTIGFVQFIKAIKDLTLLKPIYTFLLFFVFPSLLFWSSGILKEPMMLLGIGLFIRGIFFGGSTIKKILYLLCGGLLLLAFKPYILLCLLPSIAFYLVYKSLPKFKIIGSTLLIFGSFLVVTIVFSSKRDFAIQLLSKKQYDFNNIGNGGVFLKHGINFFYLLPEQFNKLLISSTEDGELEELTPEIMSLVNEGKFIVLTDTLKAKIINHGGFGEPRDTILIPDSKRHELSYLNYRSQGLIKVTMINNSGIQLIKNIPEAIGNSLLRPFPSDPGGALKYPSILEVWGTFIFLIVALIYRRKLTQRENGLIVAAVIFILSLSVLIGWVTPVVGAIVRYRFPALMGVIIISLIILKVPKRLQTNVKD